MALRSQVAGQEVLRISGWLVAMLATSRVRILGG